MSDVFGSVFEGSGSLMWMIFGIVVIGGVGLVLILGGMSFWYFKKRWNLRVEIKLPRSDGKIILGEWGKGMYDAKRGVIHIKREGSKFGSSPMEIVDPKKYLQGDNLITVIQVGPDTYKPVLNKSWTQHDIELINEETGETKLVKEAIINIEIDVGMNKAWKSAWSMAAKKAYSLSSFFTQFQTPIAVGIVVICCFVGFAIIWSRMGTIC